MVQPLKPACPLVYKKLLESLLFKDYNLKIINKCIEAGIAPFVHASQADRGSKLWKTYHIVGQFHFGFILCPEG
jgi:hypothetical protein